MKNKKYFLTLGFLLMIGAGFKYKDNLQLMGVHFVAPTVVGKTNVFQPETGEIVYDSVAKKFYGHDQDGNWVLLSAGDSIVPPGVIVPFGGTTAPSGYLLCDGHALSTTDYPDLFSAIGYAFGGSGTTFYLPDFQGRFLRGVDNGTHRDPEAGSRMQMQTGGNSNDAVGSIQGDQFKSHTHNIALNNFTNGPVYVFSPQSVGQTTSASSYSNWISPSGGSETRPINAYVNYLIKY